MKVEQRKPSPGNASWTAPRSQVDQLRGEVSRLRTELEEARRERDRLRRAIEERFPHDPALD